MLKFTWLSRTWQGAHAGDAARCRTRAGQRKAGQLSTGQTEQQRQSSYIEVHFRSVTPAALNVAVMPKFECTLLDFSSGSGSKL
jgi:hypothetical protein